MGATKIEWTDMTWSPVIGCRPISAGCAHCYAERMAVRLAHIHSRGTIGYDEVVNCAENEKHGWNGRVVMRSHLLNQPTEWRKPRTVFVSSMGDLFYKAVPDAWIREVVEVVEACPQHRFLFLTKRPSSMALAFRDLGRVPANAWLGTTVENRLNTGRVADLVSIRAAVHFLSVEPMLEAMYLSPYLGDIEWVIVGCESGPGRRPMPMVWARGVVEQCREASVPCFVKQLELDGRVIKLGDKGWPEWAKQERPRG